MKDTNVLDLNLGLTMAEVAALKDAHAHVRVHMAHQHPFPVRDAAMIAIGKVIAAAEAAKVAEIAKRDR